MISPRSRIVLKQIVEQYIDKAMPVSSQSIAGNPDLRVSSATIRNEIAHLEQEGYVIRPHTSAGSVPSDKGYRFYVESLESIEMPSSQQFMINHLFHQVEREIGRWVSLTATLLSRLVQNVAIVTMPKTPDCKLKHIEVVSLQDGLAMIVAVLHGARVMQSLVRFDENVAQTDLSAIGIKLNTAYNGLNRRQISEKALELSTVERQIKDHLIKMMQTEDEQEYEEPYLDGLHFILDKPEFAHSNRIGSLIKLVENRGLIKAIAPSGLQRHTVHVVIGKENREEAIQDYSVIISQYGIPEEATGTIGVVGPTRMPYYSAIPTVDYFSSVLTELVAGLYGKEKGADW